MWMVTRIASRVWHGHEHGDVSGATPYEPTATTDTPHTAHNVVVLHQAHAPTTTHTWIRLLNRDCSATKYKQPNIVISREL
jgi:hypothetical protein